MLNYCNVKELIEILQYSIDEFSIDENTEVLCSYFCKDTYHYEFDINFLWDTVQEKLSEMRKQTKTKETNND